ncbi:hypothetical protein B0T14DRAFT_513942 [Immersiella caudata]|uniref:Uncharacterized protein n=1 Tax=Immersiella caudata TaxID=314043 RepID=A0AA40C2E1_9PEZI|nr:hypothetical protein B0T14DRAFT_513942 [Immersiella caudata]
MPSHTLTFVGTLGIVITTVALSLLLLSGVNTNAHFLFPTSTQQQHDVVTQCGNTTTAARALGCHFDPMSFSWLPPQCYDANLTAQFLSIHAWQWFSTPERKEEVSNDAVLRGDHEYLYVSWEYHKLHCTYMWRKMHRAMLGVMDLDGYVGNYRHTEHCEDILTREERGGGNGLTVIRRKFVGCGLGAL